MKPFLCAILLSGFLSVFAQSVTQSDISMSIDSSSSKNYWVYAPSNLSAAVKTNGKLPVLVWGNGGCSPHSQGYQAMFRHFVHHGYVVVALADTKVTLLDAVNWISEESVTDKSPYFGKLNLFRMAAAGHSCGGAQAMAAAYDPRIGTIIVCNAGMGNMQMAGADTHSLRRLHKPILYLIGGPEDIAYQNALIDFDRINHVPVAMVNYPVGHGGAFHEPKGGVLGQVALQWLDWQLKKEEEASRYFLDKHYRDSVYPGGDYQSKLLSAKELTIVNGERNIYGLLNKPQDNGQKQGIVIVSHGFNGTHHFGRNYFEAFNQLGYQCYTFDFPCGSIHSQSDNNTLEMSVIDEKNDLKAIVRYFMNQPDIDPNRIVLLGESQGGLVSALAGAEMAKHISKLILVYPALCIPDNWNTRYKETTSIPDTTYLWNVPMGKRFFMELRDMNVYKTIPAFKKPVLIIQGDKDPIVSIKDSQRAVDNYKQASLYVIKGAGHGFKPQELSEAIQQMTDFLAE